MKNRKTLPIVSFTNIYRPGPEALHFQDRHGRGKCFPPFFYFPFLVSSSISLFISPAPLSHSPSLPPYPLQQVIKAWDEGVMTMKVGEKAIIKASPDYAYGAGGFAAWGTCFAGGSCFLFLSPSYPTFRGHVSTHSFSFHPSLPAFPPTKGILPNSPLNFVIEVLSVN